MRYNGKQIVGISILVDGEYHKVPNDPCNTMNASGLRDLLDGMDVMAKAFGRVMHDDYVYIVQHIAGENMVVTDTNLFSD